MIFHDNARAFAWLVSLKRMSYGEMLQLDSYGIRHGVALFYNTSEYSISDDAHLLILFIYFLLVFIYRPHVLTSRSGRQVRESDA